MRLAFDELGIAGFLCVQGSPTVAFLVQDSRDPQQVNEVHRALWNQGLASLLLVVRQKEVLAYSLMRKPVERGWTPQPGNPDPRLVETLELTVQGLEAFNLLTAVESGRFFASHPKDFQRTGRVDHVLLSNLMETQGRLTRTPEGSGLETEQAQAVLLQVMFLAYLEDRGLIDETTLGEATDGAASSLGELLDLGRPPLLERLFATLRESFNGDLFLAPCSFVGSQSSGNLRTEHLAHLAAFRNGLVEMDTGQGRFWPYDFRFIPVELISAVYDRFLSESSELQRSSGAYYTPRTLADLALEQVWELVPEERVQSQDFRIFDPACGSGVFLVQAFKRMVEALRRKTGTLQLPWTQLVQLSRKIHGWDLETNAVKLAVFSLYIALLEEAAPATVLSGLRKGHLLPRLFGKTLLCRDFFAEEGSESRFDLVLGNPPWVSRRRDHTETATQWCESRNRPSPGGQMAWAFAWKTLDHLEPGGIAGLLLPAMGFLLNRNADQARHQWLRAVHLHRVVNLSDLRFQLFERAVHPTVLCIFGTRQENEQNYRFDYWCPKADPQLQTMSVITLTPDDHSQLHLHSVLAEPRIWKQRMWMRSPEVKLHRWLSALPRLGSKLATYRESKTRAFADKPKPWIIGQGFQPALESELRDHEFSPKECKWSRDLPYLETGDFRRWVLPEVGRDPLGDGPLRRCGFSDGFKGPHVLLSQGIEPATGRLRAAFVEETLTFRHSIQGIHFPTRDAVDMKLLTAVLNSSLVAWYLFHEAANPGAERDKVHEAELLRLPFLPLAEIERNAEQKEAALEIVASIDRLLRERSDPFFEAQLTKVQDDIDDLVYRYFGLSAQEIGIIEDGVEHILPSIQPRRGVRPPLWRPSVQEDWRCYFHGLSHALGGWFAGEEVIGGEIVEYNEDVAVLKVGFHLPPSGESFVVGEQNGRLREVLSRLLEALPQRRTKNVRLMPDLRVFLDDDLYLVKPRSLRYWLRSAAVDDSDAIAAHLLAARQQGG